MKAKYNWKIIPAAFAGIRIAEKVLKRQKRKLKEKD